MLNLYKPFWGKLKELEFPQEMIETLIGSTTNKLKNPIQGDYPKWHDAYKKLPSIAQVNTIQQQNAITCESLDKSVNQDLLNEHYQKLIPWRKGPFDMFGVKIDSEWQSHMKWNRIKDKLPELHSKIILDVGCGNGYYLMRMNDSKPLILMGIDPGLLQVMQFWSIEKYVKSGACVLPLTMDEMTKERPSFDVVFSMGVLYHRKSPIHHIIDLCKTIKSGGHLVLETLVVDGDEHNCLIPNGRYAQMRNVWFLPSVAMLKIMLNRNGFTQVQCIDITQTTIKEQRSTSWMKFHSLQQFLNEDQSKTIEGYELPKRATLIAQKR